MEAGESISVIRVRDVLLVTMPADPDDATISALQTKVLEAMERHRVRGVVLDIAAVETLDSFFARTVAETAQMVALMGGRTVVAGMRPSVAITATQLGLTLGGAMASLDVDRALDVLSQVPGEVSLMSVSAKGEVPIRSEGDIVAVRTTVRHETTQLGFGITDVTRVVTAASELARNVFLYAGSGVMRWRALDCANCVGIELVFEDHGPGLPDIQQALEPGYSTSGGLGLGLPGAKRLTDEMEIGSEAGQGTTVTVRKWRGK